ncbi:hypothetical protein FHX42_004985 [Saccharopolyspora lacisalsi]|uniref:SHOCT domain-containing protein n=1 Tax=Halosaccharopolyspora lacisalsi TaxID=1000566 RepID=A0A839E400_9PSEU|nr:hypothetical protein [Halosaccharopolyspora lacisalsi]MBA8827589.1 hypothetical protein [Halosaccharopolyspora lacisalsi]
MTWQDELQHLDAELAAGRISAEEYRQRRDAALGRAQSEQPGSPSAGFPQQGQPGGGYPGQQPNPFPPAFNWGEAAQQGNQQPPAPDNSTQVVQNPVAGQQPPGQPAAPNDQSDSTQVVNLNQVSPPQQGWPAQGWQAQQPPQPQQQGWPDQPAWGQNWGTAADGGTPWGDSDLPPEHGDTSWMRQGPEVFEGAGKSRKGLIIGLSVGGVVLLGLIAAGVFYFLPGSQPRAQPPASTSTQPPTPTSDPLPEPPPAEPAPPVDPAKVLVPAPEGQPSTFTGPLPPAELRGKKSGLLTGSVREFALGNGMVDGWFNGTIAPQKTSLIAVRMPNQQAAKELTRTYLDSQTGLSTVEELSYQGVEVVSTGRVFRTAYTSHGWTIIVTARAPEGQDQTAKSRFQDVLTQQLAQTPPTVRE